MQFLQQKLSLQQKQQQKNNDNYKSHQHQPSTSSKLFAQSLLANAANGHLNSGLGQAHPQRLKQQNVIINQRNII